MNYTSDVTEETLLHLHRSNFEECTLYIEECTLYIIELTVCGAE